MRTFECFGIKFVVNVATETSPAWESKFVNVDGRMIVDWVATDGVHTTSYTEAVTVQDDGFCKEAKNIEVFSTADGPIMGIVFASSPYEHTLLDPCIVQFDHKGSKIDLLPIFNVARKLRIMRSAVRSVQAPAEVLLAAYPGFLINNRMSKYQLKPSVPMAQTPELTNDAS